MKGLVVRELTPPDADALSAMLLSASPEYQRYFAPFPFDEASIRKMLESACDDRYWAICFGRDLAGFVMLRGFDNGYEVPSYGVSICERFARRGLLKLSLSFVIAWCRLNDIPRMMLKVHPDNFVAKGAYERIGFSFDRAEPSSGQLVYYLDLEYS